MIDALLGAAMMYGFADKPTINIEQPHKGDYSNVIVQSAQVPERWKPFATCVLDRESGGTLNNVQSGVRARNPRSSASGRWQFLNSQWNHGLPYAVSRELKRNGMPKDHAKKIRIELQKRPIHTWHGYWQDIGFVATVTDGGWFHWNGGNGCNSQRP